MGENSRKMKEPSASLWKSQSTGRCRREAGRDSSDVFKLRGAERGLECRDWLQEEEVDADPLRYHRGREGGESGPSSSFLLDQCSTEMS